MGDYDPKKKGLPLTWRALQRRLPTTLSTFQVLVVAAFLSLLILRSSFRLGSSGVVGRSSSSSSPRRVYSDDLDTKRSLVQRAEQELERIRQSVASKTKETALSWAQEAEPKSKLESEPEDDPHRKDVSAASGAEMAGGRARVDEKKLQKESLPRKSVGKEALEETMRQVEAELAEEETPEELAEFEKADEGKGKPDPRADDKPSRPKPTSSKSESSNRKIPSLADRTTPEREVPEELEKSGKTATDLDAKQEQEKSGAVAEKAEEKQALMPVEVAVEKMEKALRRDDPDAYTLGPKISDWDGQRAQWMAKHPGAKSADPHRPNVLLLTGSQPWPCRSAIGDHYLLKMIKNKVDYGRIHRMEVFYNLAHLDRAMTTYWAKLPIIRKMMLTRPEMEWIFWVDSDAMFTDMVFEVPFEKYEGRNLVMWGADDGLYEQRSWVACNTGVFLLRNSQWALDLLEAWSHMGPHGAVREAAGSVLSRLLPGRPEMPADDQCALVFLMLTRPELRSKIRLESEFALSGYWAGIVDKYEEISAKSRPGARDHEWPFTTHFTGCQPCTGENNEVYRAKQCLDAMERAFNFADNQVLRPFGFMHESLEAFPVKRIRNETTNPLRTVPLLNPWAVESFY